jgi:hypothetical protein
MAIKKISLFFLIALGMILTTGCGDDDDDDDEPEPRTNASYGVAVVQASNSYSADKTEGTDGVEDAVVIINQNGKKMTDTTGEDGLASFTNLTPGTVSGVVKAEGHATVNFTADITQDGGLSVDSSGGNVDFSSLTGDEAPSFNAGSIIPLFPTSGDASATVEGIVSADLNETVTGNETVSGAELIAIAEFDFEGTESGPGGVESYSIEGAQKSTTTSSNGTYSITVPASAAGVTVRIHPQDFTREVQTSPNDTERGVFSASSFSIDAKTGGTYIRDITYTN